MSNNLISDSLIFIVEDEKNERNPEDQSLKEI